MARTVGKEVVRIKSLTKSKLMMKKTTHLNQIMQIKGLVVCIVINEHILFIMELNLYNLNISCIQSTLNLHSNIDFIFSTFEKWLELLFNAIPTGSATHTITQLVALKVPIFLLYILHCFLLCVQTS